MKISKTTVTAYERERDDTSRAGGNSEHAGKSRGIQNVCVHSACVQMCVVCARTHVYLVGKPSVPHCSFAQWVLSAIQATKVMLAFFHIITTTVYYLLNIGLTCLYF